MSQILNRVRDVDPNDSDAIKEALTVFFQNLPKHRDSDCNRWLRTLENVINRFPKYCGQHRLTIENYLCHFLDSNNYYNVIEAAKCSHAVQQVRPQQERTASAKSCWRDQMSSLCEAAQLLISTIYTRNSGIYNRNGKAQKDDTQTLSPLHEALADIDTVTKTSDVTNKSAVLSIRLRNVLVFIQAMLVDMYPVAKPVRPQLVLEVILQALSASGNEDSAQVTLIKVQALRTLDAIVACLGSNLIPFSALVFRFVMQTLRWSSEHPSEESRKVRCAAYRSLTNWLGALVSHRAGSRARGWHDELTSHVLADVTPPVHVIQLTPNAQPMKNLSKKARKKLANSLLMQSNISAHMPGEKNKINASDESNEELAISALECVEAFLITCGVFLKPTTHKQLQELLVRECYNLSRYSACRAIWQLRALDACRKCTPPALPPCTQYCLQLYSALVNDSTSEISKFASQALLDIRLHLHCSPQSLNFSLDQPPQRKQTERKRVSDRNRAVLESLLGQERMPSEDLAEKEVITIPDEPTNKKPRLSSEVTDKISLSSESQTSIEISDSSSVEEVENEEDQEQDDSTDYIIEPDKDFDMQDIEQEIEQSNQDLTDAAKTNTETDDLTDAEDEQIDTDGKTDETEAKTDVTDGKTDVTDQKSYEISDNSDEGMMVLTQRDPEDVPSQEYNIYEARTQLPLPVNVNEQTSPTISLSNEVIYDYPSTGQEKVKVLEKMDEDNLPSTNETDDSHITCGQAVKYSQDIEGGKELEVTESNEIPKQNGVEKSPERVLENGDANLAEIEGTVTAKIAPNDEGITVEDMLADFVDEVNDETQTPAQT